MKRKAVMLTPGSAETLVRAANYGLSTYRMTSKDRAQIRRTIKRIERTFEEEETPCEPD